MARKKKSTSVAYKYIGPKAQALRLASGAKVVNPAELSGERLEYMLKHHPELQRYFVPLDAAEEE